MSGLIQDIRNDALSSTVPLTTLLRKAYAASVLLGEETIIKWLNLEMNGYGAEPVPPYRILKGQVIGISHTYGEKPITFSQKDVYEKVTSRPIGESIPELEVLVNSSECEMIRIYLADHFFTEWRNSGWGAPDQVALDMPTTQFHAIIEKVRNMVLEWALMLESKNILGEHMAFTKEEKQGAGAVTNTFITKIENSPGAQIQSHSPAATQSIQQELTSDAIIRLVKGIEESMTPIKFTESELLELKSDIDAIKGLMQSSKPKYSVIQQCFQSIKNIYEQAAAIGVGGVITTQILQQFHNLGI